MTIKRIKSSELCKRHPVSAHTTLPLALQRMPILSSNQQCSQTIIAGIMEQVKCQETLILTPLSANEGGATTTDETSLVHVGTSSGVTSAGK